MKNRTFLSYCMCTMSCLLFVTPSFAADPPGNNNNTPGDNEMPDYIIRRSPSQQPIMVSYYDGLLTLSSRQPYENVEITIINVETGEQYEITLGAVEDEVSVPIHLTDGEYAISLISDQNLYSFTFCVEED